MDKISKIVAFRLDNTPTLDYYWLHADTDNLLNVGVDLVQ
jgi:hypothetical protein